MTNPTYNHSDAEQLRARQVGAVPTGLPQQPLTLEYAAHPGAELDQQVEQVRWLMRHEPMLEGRELLNR
jgi:hypothetical protein